MQDLSILSIILTVAILLLGIYFRESLSKAYKQKQLVIRLDAYLSMWNNELSLPQYQNIIQKLEEPFEGLYQVFIKRAGVTDSRPIYDQFIFMIFEKVTELLPNWEEVVKSGFAEFQNQGEVVIDMLINNCNEVKTNMHENKTFLSEAEASMLGIDIALGVTRFKTQIIGAFGFMSMSLTMLKCNADYSKNVLLIAGYFLMALRSMKELRSATLKFRATSIHHLFWLNLIGKI